MCLEAQNLSQVKYFFLPYNCSYKSLSKLCENVPRLISFMTVYYKISPPEKQTNICYFSLPGWIHSCFEVCGPREGLVSHSLCCKNVRIFGLRGCRKEGTGVAAVDFTSISRKNHLPLLQISLMWTLSCDRFVIAHTFVRKHSHMQFTQTISPMLFAILFNNLES